MSKLIVICVVDIINKGYFTARRAGKEFAKDALPIKGIEPEENNQFR